MKIIKRNGTEAEFDASKIKNAVQKANDSVPEYQRMNQYEIESVVDSVSKTILESHYAMNVEEIQDIVILRIAKYSAPVSISYQKYRYKRERQNLGHAHNNFIHTTVESGVIGLAGLIYFLGFWLYASLRNYRKNKNPYDILVFTTILGYLCIFGQIDYTLGISTGMRTMFFLLAVLLQMKETESQPGKTPSLPGVSAAEFQDPICSGHRRRAFSGDSRNKQLRGLHK